jgi:transposase
MPKIIANKWLIINACNNKDELGLSYADIAMLLKVNIKTLYNYRHQTDEFLAADSIIRKSFMHSLTDDVIKFVLEAAINKPFFNIKRTTYDVNKLYKTNLSNRQIYAILHYNNITYKKAFPIRKSSKPAAKIQEMIEDRTEKVINCDDIVFTDEVHIDFAECRGYGWNEKGKPAKFDLNAKAKTLNKRITVIASVSKSKKIGYKIHEKSVNGATFRSYVKYINKKSNCKNHFIDNARIHHAGIVKKTCNRLKLNVIYGVPYTPRLNVIEYFFRSFKSKLRKIPYDKRVNIKQYIRKCWNEVEESVIVNSYNHVYGK